MSQPKINESIPKNYEQAIANTYIFNLQSKSPLGLLVFFFLRVILVINSEPASA